MRVVTLEDRRRRRFGAALVLSLCLHALLAFLPVSPLRGGPEGPDRGSGGQGGLLRQFLAAALQGAEIEVAVPPSAPATAVAPEPTPVPPEPVVVPDASTTAQEPQNPARADGGAPGAMAGAGAVGQGGPTGGEGGEGPPDLPAEMAIRPREYVPPRIPEEIVRKRKIDDFVLLQVLVGTDGSVREVRVLRAIPNCAECTASSVEAARRLRYDPVLLDGRLVEMWTVPFDYHFFYQR